MLVSWNKTVLSDCHPLYLEESPGIALQPLIQRSLHHALCKWGPHHSLSVDDRFLQVAAIFQDTFMFLILFGGMIPLYGKIGSQLVSAIGELDLTAEVKIGEWVHT